MTARGPGPRGRSRWPVDDSGAAMVEFVLLAVVLVVPLAYLVLAVFEVQRAAFATTAAVREAGRVFVVAPSGPVGELHAHQAVALAFGDQGLGGRSATVDIACSADPCLSPGARVTVRVEIVVSLPFVPWLGHGPAASIPVRASHTETVDAYAETGP